jgi:hypothetical protein
VWLPGVMVVAAVLGHALVYRRLWIESRSVSERDVADAARDRGGVRDTFARVTPVRRRQTSESMAPTRRSDGR